MVRSLRARVQLWHGLTLFVMVAGLGAFLYVRIELATFQQVDADLEGSAQLLVALLKEVPTEDLAAGKFDLPELTSTRRVLLPPDRRRPPRDREPRPERQPPARHVDAAPYFIVWNA
ncbi:MAG TPA: hypothetical protein VL096_03905, partial [Pirellulaceae bacterium]|nr:hypothetical protein [Pirellulaceae bacterium]